MKTLIGISIAASMLLSLTGMAQQNTNNDMNDDGIYSPQGNNASASQPATAQKQAAQSNTDTHMGPADSGVNNYTSTDNYYSQDYDDYNYSAQLRRYDDNWGNNWGYYDDVYTNSYWYNYNPYAFGMSIYYPSYWAFGWGYPYFGFGWGFGYPYWGWGHGWGSWYGGWGRGWGCSAWGGYYNSYDRNSNFVGPRTTPSVVRGGSPVIGPGVKGGPAVGPGERSFGEMYQNSIHEEALKNPGSFVRSGNGSLHIAPVASTNRLTSGHAISSRPIASYRSNTNMNSSAMNNRSNPAYSTARNYNNVARTNSARPSNSGRGYNGSPARNSSYSSSRIAPNQGSRSSGNYNYHPSNSGSRNYGGGNHSFGGSTSHSSGGSHSFGGGGGHSFGGGGGGHSSGGGGGHGGSGHR